MKLILKILLILFLFSLGPIGYVELERAISKSTYELTQAQGMFPDEPFRTDIYNHYIKKMILYWTIAIVGPLLGIFYIFLLQRKQ